ncbi:hypothetical protein SLS62_003085 [Diatrype stigma]|uniref:BZIP domain-containing protein n=1 Tax=Diatrype stigma TaxID=117547 RepID=A0AAN9YRS3_9PEZI
MATTTTTEDSLRRRRERGRRAQAGFRKRQAEANQHIAEQNLQLKTAIEKLVKAVHGDERLELLNAISDVAEVAEVAGIDVPRPGTTETNTHTSTNTQSEDDDNNTVKPSSTGMSNSTSNDGYSSSSSDGDSSSNSRPDGYASSGDSSNNNSSKYDGGRQVLICPVDSSTEDIVINATTRDVVRKANLFNNCLQQPHQQQQQHPRLMCGIWLDHMHYMRVSMPPDDILPYLGAGSDTFAGILFWSMMDHSQMKCAYQQHRTYQHPNPKSNPPTRKVQCHSDIQALIRQGLSHSTVTAELAVSYVQAMIEARQEYRRTGTISARLASAAEPDLGLIMRDRISAEYAARGRDPGRWLSALGIAARVRGLVGDGAFALLEAAARGEGEPGLRGMFEDIACTLHETCICFGDGPRWSVEMVDGLFLDWVHTALWSA